MPNRGVVALAVAALLVSAIGLSRWHQIPAPPSAQSLSLAIAENLLDLPVFVAVERGFYQAEGLSMRYQSHPTGKQALEALLRGEVEAAVVAETPLVVKSFERRDFVIIASFVHNHANSRVIARSDRGIDSVQGLRSRRVGVIAGTTAQFFLHALLADHGLSRADITEVPLPAPQMADALAQGQVDAVAAFQPFAHHALAALGGQGLDLGTTGRTRETFNYVTRRDLPAQRREALVRLLRATDRAVDWLRGHRAQAVAIVARRMAMEEPVLDALWDGYRPGLTLDQTLLLSLEDQARWAIETGLVGAARPPNYLDFLEPSALDAVRPEAVTFIR